VASHAETGVGASFHRVAGDEAGTVEAREWHLIEHEPRRQRGDGADSVASGARSLGVAACAEITCARGSDAVLADPVAVMDEVTRRWRILRSEVLVTAVAVAKRPLILVLVTAEACGHFGPHRVRVLVGRGLVASDAIAVRRRLVSSMLEPEVLARDLRTLSRVRRAVAAEARMLIMRFGVAADTRLVGRHVKRFHLAEGAHSLVAVYTVDPVRRVSTVFERMRRVVGA